MKFDITKMKRSSAFKGGYSSYLDGKFHHYQGLEQSMDEIKDNLERYNKLIEEYDAEFVFQKV